MQPLHARPAGGRAAAKGGGALGQSFGLFATLTNPNHQPTLALQVAALLQKAGAHSAKAVAEAEEALAMKELTVEEARERQNRLAKMRALLFYHEVRAVSYCFCGFCAVWLIVGFGKQGDSWPRCARCCCTTRCALRLLRALLVGLGNEVKNVEAAKPLGLFSGLRFPNGLPCMALLASFATVAAMLRPDSAAGQSAPLQAKAKRLKKIKSKEYRRKLKKAGGRGWLLLFRKKVAQGRVDSVTNHATP